jgi:hypothetical protein
MESYVGICYEYLSNSGTLASMQEYYICFTDNLDDACSKMYSVILRESNDAITHKTYHIEKYDLPVDELCNRSMLPYPINFFTFNAEFECICNKTKDVVWSP